MTKNEKINRNIGLSFDFLRETIKEPSLLNIVSDGSEIEFIEKDFVRKDKKNSNKTKYYKVRSIFESAKS